MSLTHGLVRTKSREFRSTPPLPIVPLAGRSPTRLHARPRCLTTEGGRMILVPATSLEDWKKLVTDRDEQWKPGSPANPLATSWHGLMKFPREISALFSGSDTTRGASLLLAIPEHQVPLAGGALASQTDLWLLARTPTGLLSVVVEGKVSESFGPSVGHWQAGETPGKRAVGGPLRPARDRACVRRVDPVSTTPPHRERVARGEALLRARCGGHRPFFRPELRRLRRLSTFRQVDGRVHQSARNPGRGATPGRHRTVLRMGARAGIQRYAFALSSPS